MDTSVQSSFIPPDSAKPGTGGTGRGSIFDLLTLVAVIVLVSSVALAIGVFLYNQFIETSKKSKIDQLERAKAAFDPALIEELTRFDDRMNAAQVLLSNHIAPSLFFHMLELATLQTVSFKSLVFNVVDQKDITIKMDGIAASVNSVALQADIFSKNGLITSPIFSGVNRQRDGVHFNLEALVNPNAIRYSQFFVNSRSVGNSEGVQETLPGDEESSSGPDSAGPLPGSQETP